MRFGENKGFCVFSLCVFICLLGTLRLLTSICFVFGLFVPLRSPMKHWFALRHCGDPGRSHCWLYEFELSVFLLFNLLPVISGDGSHHLPLLHQGCFRAAQCLQSTARFFSLFTGCFLSSQAKLQLFNAPIQLSTQLLIWSLTHRLVIYTCYITGYIVIGWPTQNLQKSADLQPIVESI